MLAEFDETRESYALKILAKSVVIKTGQLRHVINERKHLSEMNSPFILKFFGAYQTPNDLVLVTELLQGTGTRVDYSVIMPA